MLSLILGAVIWQVAAAHASPLVMAPLPQIWDSFTTAVGDGTLLTNFVASFEGFAVGLVLSSVAGILIGVAMAVSTIVLDFLDPWVAALYSTPLVALAPLFIIVFGIGFDARVAVVFTLCIFPVMINTTAGIKTTDPKLIETARAFGANGRQIFIRILLPWSVPFIITGLRLAIGRGLIAVVVAEFFGSTNGLGHAVFIATQTYNTAAVWMGIFVLAALGTILIRLMLVLERKVAPWRVSQLTP